MGLKIIETYDAQFSLNPDAKTALFALLKQPEFLAQVAANSQLEAIEFTEKFHESADHAIVNVPPNFMFQAKIFKPSRLCAVYRKV
jgi:hypothetical protein